MENCVLESIRTLFSPPENENLQETEVETTKSELGGINRTYKAFIERLGTYTHTSWLRKPAHVSPLSCARVGWKCSSEVLLECVTCRQTISAKTPDPINRAACDVQCARLASRLLDDHLRSCPWRYHPCPSTFLAVPWHSKSASNALQMVLQEAKYLAQLGQNLPQTHSRLISTDQLEALVSLSRQRAPNLLDWSKEDEVKSALILALNGWTKSDKRDDGLLRTHPTVCCKICRRTLGLWNFIQQAGKTTQEDKLQQKSVQSNHDNHTSLDVDIDSKSKNIIADVTPQSPDHQSNLDNSPALCVDIDHEPISDSKITEDIETISHQTILSSDAKSPTENIQSEHEGFPLDLSGSSTIKLESCVKSEAYDISQNLVNCDSNNIPTESVSVKLDTEKEKKPAMEAAVVDLSDVKVQVDPTENGSTHGKRKIEEKSIEDGSPVLKKRCLMRLDPVRNHWSWCPWTSCQQLHTRLLSSLSPPSISVSMKACSGTSKEDSDKLAQMFQEKCREFRACLRDVCRASKPSVQS